MPLANGVASSSSKQGDRVPVVLVVHVGLRPHRRVDDVEAALAKAESLGGTRVMGPETIMDSIVLGQFTDPEGHLIGVVKPLQM